MTTPSIVLIALLVVYSVAGGAFAFNAMRISDRAARRYQNYPWLLRQIGRDNPLAWRSGRLIMLATGALLLVWLGAGAIWQLPPMNRTVGAGILLGIAVVSIVGLVLNRRSNQ